MARIILHIGTHKTGTTTIQRTLAKYRGRLRARGIWYPSYAEFGMRAHYAHIGMANALGGDHPTYTPAEAERFFAGVAAGAARHDATLLSAESFYRQTLGETSPQEAPDAESYWAMRDAYIARLRSLIGPAEIALVLRERDAFAESLYQEHVKVTRYARPFARFIDEFWFHFDYAGQISAWRRHFPEVHVFAFGAIRGRDIAKRLLNRLGLAPGRLTPVANQNASLPHDAVILKRACNAALVDRAELSRFAEALASERFRAAVAKAPRSFFADVEAHRGFLARYGEEHLAPTADGNELRYGDRLTEEEKARLVEVLAGLLGDGVALRRLSVDA